MKSRSWSGLFAVLFITVLLFVGSAVGLVAQQKVIKWVGASVNDPGSPAQIAIEKACTTIADASGGRLVLKVHPTGAIVPFGKEWDALRAKTVDFINSTPTWAADRVPAAGLVAYMVGGLSPMEFFFWVDFGGGAALIEKIFVGSGGHWIPGGGYINTPETFMYSKKPITKLADLKGVKMRTAGDGGLVLSKLGVSVVSIPYPEIYDSMKRGVLDAFEAGNPSYDITQGMHEVSPYIIVSGARQPMEYLPMVVREDRWKELPADLKIIVEKVWRDMSLEIYGTSVRDDGAAIAKFIAYGCKVSPLPADIEAALYKAADEVYAQKAAKDPLTAEVLKSMQSWKKVVRDSFPRL
jgi:TRAP-type mannitol/chloroaromatic compound transport system substrate-binding protein